MAENIKTPSGKSRRLRYGGTAVLLTAAVIAVVVIMNVIFSALATNFKWYIDMTTEGLYSISDSTHALLDPLADRDDVHIRIIFCTDEDELESSYYSKLVHQSALLYASAFDFVSVEYIDVNAHPGEISAFRTTSGSKIRTNSVIITNDTNGDYRVFTTDSFYTLDESNEPYALNAEYKITTAILGMTGDNPIAYFTKNHGETTGTSALWQLLEDAGYEVREVDLQLEDIDYERAQLLIINGPQYDFAGYGADVDEIKKVDEFLDSIGSMMVFMDSNARSKNDFFALDELLSEWGITFGNSVVYDKVNSINVSGTALVSVYETEGDGATLTKSMRTLDNVPKSIVTNAMPVISTYETDERTIDQGTRTISNVLLSSPESYTCAFGSDEVESTGSQPLMTFTTELRYIDNEAHRNFVLACGTTEFVSEKYIGRNTYGNVELLYSAMKTMGKVTVPNGIEFKIFDNNELDITAGEAYAWTVVLATLLPVTVAVVGIVVYVRRKRL